MEPTEKQQRFLRNLPGVDSLLELAWKDTFFDQVPKTVVKRAVRRVIDGTRDQIMANEPTDLLKTGILMEKVKAVVNNAMTPNLRRVVNATGVVVHTNLGRSLLAKEAVSRLAEIAATYSNLEFDISKGKRGLRYSLVEDLLCEISGAEAAMVVNNNAGAVLVCLDTLARGREVIVSRGELVEIGGSFRIPDVMAKSGGILKEVGTTNRTHLGDYEDALTNETGLLLKVHTSNYSVVGFTADVPLKTLVALGRQYHLPVMEDLGSGTFVDFSRFGLEKEPTVQESVASGADIVTFSGDKLLGGPQSGLIVGKKDIIEGIRKNPLTRALRIDKLTLSALESTLRIYRDMDRAVEEIPTLRLLARPLSDIEKSAVHLAEMLKDIGDSRLDAGIRDDVSKAGGGSLPLLELPSKCIGIRVEGMSANRLEKQMRLNTPPIIGRIEEDLFIIDLRTVLEDDVSIICQGVARMLKKE